MRKYQIYAHILVSGDGYVLANNKKEAIEKTREFLSNEMAGISVMGVEITDVITERSKYFDAEGFPPEEEFDGKDYVTYSFLN